MILQILGVGLMTLGTVGAKPFQPSDPFAVAPVGPPAANPKPNPFGLIAPSPNLPFGLAAKRRRVRPPVRIADLARSMHRDHEQGPVIRTEDGILHCEGHLFRADRDAKPAASRLHRK